MIPVCLAVLVVLYFLMIMPRIVYKPDTSPFMDWLYAHRGLHDNAEKVPENSLIAFRKAVEGGFGIELDVQMSRDGVPVVFHDFTLKRMCGVEGRVCDYSYDELQRFSLIDSGERIPKLAEVLKLVNGRTPLIVELKEERTDMSVCRAVDRLCSRYTGLYCIESFNPLVVFWYRRHRKNIVRGQLSDAFIKEGEYVGTMSFLLQNLMFNWVGRPDFIAYNCKYPKMLSARLCRRLYHSKAAAWTVRSREQLAEARKNFDIFIFDSFVPKGKLS
ncbi:MAG TPA: glycerophosphodiester phosphodiesterase [Lachnospiraceae bacterium]|nr:glycerophosphodiester phosphodiesterase [Lachnospiraceae bacterium]HCT92676.1 glycerophosphodiester phosphodiesterase [Lachnospiraceae bacterium]